MIKLKNVSKFYYNKGIIASGFSNVSLDLNIGEFVVITGESGSGKSTLLNVISGLDTYEEGEMYINGLETSHYNEKDFEEYRKKYIGNIFQNFNLVNSYTVYQNIELVLLLNGFKKKNIKKEIMEIIKEVDLYKYRRTKVSKLSGGQKQRVAIARALAKKTPIIIADEPTGNLDTKAAKSVMKILSNIAKDKLVIVVTHNYEQVSEYTTRKIVMHDGHILENKEITNVKEIKDYELPEYTELSFFNTLRLGIRNTFNVIPKFVLLFMVYAFIVIALISVYSSLKKSEYEEKTIGYNPNFADTSKERVILKKKDLSSFTEEDYLSLSKMTNIDHIVKDDIMIDSMISVVNNDMYMMGNVKELNSFEGSLDLGRMPENDNEVILAGDKDDYYIGYQGEELLKNEYTIQESIDRSTIKIVGIKYLKSNNYYYEDYKFYVSDKILDSIKSSMYQSYSTTTGVINKTDFTSDQYNSLYKLVPSDNVLSGKAYVSEDINYLCRNFNCLNNNLSINIKNKYFEDNLELKVNKVYNKNNFTRLTGLNDYETNNGVILLNSSDYYNIFNKGNYQVSVYLKDTELTNETIEELNKSYTTLMPFDTLYNYASTFLEFLRIIRVIVISIVSIALFFISYFIIKLIMKSRNIYFSTIRILGASKKVTNDLMNLELLTISNLIFVILVTLAVLINKDIIVFAYGKELLSYLKITDYILCYLSIVCMSLLITRKYSKSLFNKSAMKSYREEV